MLHLSLPFIPTNIPAPNYKTLRLQWTLDIISETPSYRSLYYPSLGSIKPKIYYYYVLGFLFLVAPPTHPQIQLISILLTNECFLHSLHHVTHPPFHTIYNTC